MDQILKNKALTTQKPSVDAAKLRADIGNKKWKRFKVRWFPIYAEKPNQVQIDLTMLPISLNNKETNIAFLTLIFINTRYAFVQPVEIEEVEELPENTTQEGEKAYMVVGEDDDIGKKARKSKKTRYSYKTSKKVFEAFQHILDIQMPNESNKVTALLKPLLEKEGPRVRTQENRRMTRSMTRAQQQQQDQNKTFGRIDFKVNYIQCDSGSEFKGDFKAGCEARGINIHYNDPKKVSKRQVGLIERFNRTFKNYIYNKAKEEGHEDGPRSMTKEELMRIVPRVLKDYNLYTNHRTIKEFKLSELEEDEKAPPGMVWSPLLLLVPGEEEKFKQYQIRKRDKRVEHYKPLMDYLDQGGVSSRAWKRPTQQFKGKKKGDGDRTQNLKPRDYTDPKRIIGRHTYTKTTRGPGRRNNTRQEGLSYDVEGESMTYLPYEFLVS
eukprot:CAMPEP_0117751282 /NCGR_PEP_ID=MMETSP0947-20121206/10878_1 /TAXON_ID=44440 /ORGANISM="Chattonella subsalsa, Strain CCMP2191" /LENGTH=436 /DNA_ID=CAMNT_0005569625 /DNA_START=354 /DNA_END=1667 /DNA_ORIENTATION=-